MPKHDPQIARFGARTLSRRHFLAGTIAVSSALLLPTRAAFPAEAKSTLPDDAKQAMAKSALIYLTPMLSNGKESTCHAEVWFAHLGNDVYVVTSSSAWRAQAIEKGLDRARIWVGDYGPWRGNSKFKSAPNYMAKAGVVAKGDSAIESVLSLMGEKYASEWGKWEPRFRSALGDGSRVMLRYRPVGA
jgi:hypothetical protein